MNIETFLDETAVATFVEGFRGEVLRPDEGGYDDAREIWNAMIDRHPALVARCAGVADVIAAVSFAREQNLVISVHGGGHNIAGNAVCDGGVMIDLSPLNSVQVDPVEKTARVEPGVVLSEFDHEAQAFGLATPVGYNSTTGVAGLTLGGGWGWLSRTYGLTVDNLLSADVVTAAGDLIHASEDENSDLFWGLRGGSGNFGIVTSFEFELHEVGPTVLSGPIVHPFDDAEAVLSGFREFAASAPNEATVWCVIRHAPPLPFIPEEWHGRKVIILAAFYAGDMEAGEDVLQPVRDIGDPIADAVGPHLYTGWQQAFDGLAPAGNRQYWKSHNFEEMTDGMIETFVEYGKTIPTQQTEIAIPHLGGAINDLPVETTAYPHRDAEYIMNLHTQWEDPTQDEKCIAWARDMHEAMTPHATGGTYVNFIPETEGAERAAYRENYDRLVEIKTKYDPENLFSMNQNVEPNTTTRTEPPRGSKAL